MINQILNICNEKMDILFPFHIIFDMTGKIIHSGKSNTKLFGYITDQNFHSIFKIKRPSHLNIEQNSMQSILDQVIILESRFIPDLMFRGQFVQFDPNTILFAGSPWMTDVNDLDKFHLNITDFAIHNTITDMMQILNSNQMVMNDIKELVNKLKSQKSELNNANTRLRTLIQNLQSAILVEDENRHIVLTNQAFCDIFHIPANPSDLIGMDCSNAAEQSKHLFLHPDQFTGRINEILSNKNLVTNELLYLADGTILERDFIPITYEGSYNGHLWQYKDVTLQKKAELQIKQSEEKYKSVIENLKLSLIEVDVNNCIVKAYPQFCELTGYSESELFGKNSYELMYDHTDLEKMKTENEKRIKGKAGVYDIRLKKKNGDFVWVTISGAPIYDLNNHITGSIGINLDITERKQKEEEYKKAKEIAEQSVKTKQQFLSNVSHEIRTPLNVIIGMSEILMQSSNNDVHKEDLSIIKNSANHLLSVINDILDLAKIESGKMNVNPTNIHFRSAIKEQIQIQNINARNKGIKLHYNIDENIPDDLIGDETKLNQVLTNLLNNAIKFTEKGFIYLEIKLKNISKEEIRLLFSISDTGIGIPPDKLDTIFESFSQANNHFNKSFGGTGLGLSIVKNIISLCNGEVWVESELNRGSTFYFELPFGIGSSKTKEENQNDQLNEEILLKDKKILIVEDNKLNQVVAKRILEQWGCVTESAMDGYEAIEKLKHNAFDIILMDIQMPGIDGFETTSRVRKELKAELPIIAMTAYSNAEIKEECLKVGMNEIVSKPFKKSELRKTLCNLLQKSIRSSKNTDYLNNEYLKDITGGDRTLLNQLIGIFIDETPKNLNAIKNSTINKDSNGLKTALHKYKSSIKTFCITHIDDLIEETENKLQSGNWEEITQLSTKIIQESNKEVQHLKQTISKV